MKLYRIINQRTEGADHLFEVQFDAGHAIYDGHFPDMPVTPGVMLVSMMQDLVEGVLGARLTLTEAKNIKFLKPVLPGDNKRYAVRITIDTTVNGCLIKAAAQVEEVIYFKLSASFDRVK